MKFNLKSQTASGARPHLLEMPSSSFAAPVADGRVQFVLDGETREADWAEISPGVYSILLGGMSYEASVSRPAASPRAGARDVAVSGHNFHIEVEDPRGRRAARAALTLEGPQEILAPMPGRIVKVLVVEEQHVERGEGLLVIEAMKMQNELRASRPGRVEKVYVSEGAGVESGSKLLRLV